LAIGSELVGIGRGVSQLSKNEAARDALRNFCVVDVDEVVGWMEHEG
jgi:hypothetical protein